MSTLYQKYRPQKFADLIGQEHIVQTITNEIKSNKLAHAYLFFGPRGIGKTTIARLLAKALNCENRKNNEFEPCDKCVSCQEITANRHIDVIEVDAASHTGVDNVRENIIENAQFKPTKAPYKIFIIDEVHMLSTSAFNALLKTLEEPPAHVIFILATTELHKLPATIVSRCQRFGFKKIGYDTMLASLEQICEQEKINVEKKVLERVINKSDGCLRDAQSLLGQILSLNLKKITVQDVAIVLPTSNVESVLLFIENILSKQAKEAIILLRQLTEEGINLDQFAYDVIEVMRLMMICQIDKTKEIAIDYSEKDAKNIKKMTEKISLSALIQIIEKAIKRRAEIKSAPIPQLPLELLAAETTLTCHSDQAERDEASVKNQSCNQIISKQENIEPQKSTITKIKEKVTFLTHKKPLKTSCDEIKNCWTKLVEEITAENHSLGFILKMSSVNKIEDNVLNIAVPYSFHKDKLEEIKNKKIIEKQLEDVFKEKIDFCCQIVPGFNSQKETSTTSDPEINDLAANFGGEVVS